MADNRERAAELDQLADDLDAVYARGMGDGPDPFPDDRPGPWLDQDDRHATGFEAVARYARQRAEWLRRTA